MEIRHLKYFVMVAKERNFTRAAKRLNIEQPPLSQQIRQLESEIGTPLFERLPRGVKLTDAGKVFFNDAQDILGRAQMAVENAQLAAQGGLGRIHVGMINSAPFHPFVPRLIREYGQHYPDVHLSLEEETTPTLAQMIVKGDLDVAIVRPLLGDGLPLEVETLFDEEMVVALPQGHRLSKQKAVSMSALANEHFVLFSREVGSGLYDEILAACQHAGFSPLISQEVRHVTSIANLVAADLGVSVVPISMQHAPVSGVVYRPIVGAAPQARMSLIYRKNDRSALMQNFVSLAHQIRRRLRL